MAGRFFKPNGHVLSLIHPMGLENVHISCDLLDNGTWVKAFFKSNTDLGDQSS